ncbi:FliO/MopB family protein [Paremcibacter congregatus]|uniref:FliO/MopB family protein n=1 Tax=Paremcibacter congregatus TaxID=2043170 RepID=UPI003A90945B
MELGAYMQFIVALLFVIGLIFLLAYVAKRFGLMARVTIGTKGATGKRLNVVEIMPLDARRKLILIRRDDKEHLILLGVEHDVVIEQNIPLPDGAGEPQGRS